MSENSNTQRTSYNVTVPNLPVQAIGRISNDPELKYFADGKAVMNVSMAFSRYYPDGNGGFKENTSFLRFSIWGDRAEQFANKRPVKGDVALVEFNLPDLKANPFKRQDGTEGASIEAPASSIKIVARKAGSTMAEIVPDAEEVIPFA